MPKSRLLVLMASSVLVALLLMILVFRGGGTVPPTVDEARPASSLGSLAQQAKALAAEGDYIGAWRLYHQALQAAPEDVSLWYGVGVTLSHLNRPKETEEAFRYVVHYGRPDSEEVGVARRWLASAGALVEPVARTIAPEPGDVSAGDVSGDTAVLKGKATWGEPEANRPPLSVQILLDGLDGAAKGKRFVTRVALGESFRFERLPAGSYRLIGWAGHHLLWDLTVSVEASKEVVQDLRKDISTNPSAAL